MAAREALAGFEGDVLVTNGDCPLLTPADLEPLFELRSEGADLALLGFEPVDGLLYGRMMMNGMGEVSRIVEPKDASPAELAVKTCYAGMLCADKARLFGWLDRTTNDNAKGEYYLTQVVALAAHDEAVASAAIVPESSVMGCDTPMQLSQAERIFQDRRRAHFLAEGVGMLAPWRRCTFPSTRRSRQASPSSSSGSSRPVSPSRPASSSAPSATRRARWSDPAALIGPYARLRPGCFRHRRGRPLSATSWR